MAWKTTVCDAEAESIRGEHMNHEHEETTQRSKEEEERKKNLKPDRLLVRRAPATVAASPHPYLVLSPSFSHGVDRVEESGVTLHSFGICCEETSLI